MTDEPTYQDDPCDDWSLGDRNLSVWVSNNSGNGLHLADDHGKDSAGGENFKYLVRK